MDKIIKRSLHLHCSSHEAFELFTLNDRLQSWLAPQAEVEPRAGGLYELFWSPPDRENDSTVGCRITAIEPDELLSFEWRSPRQFKAFANSADPLTHVVVVFIPAEGGTHVHLLHSGWRSATEWEQARLWQSRAWELAFTQLDRLVNAISA